MAHDIVVVYNEDWGGRFSDERLDGRWLRQVFCGQIELDDGSLEELAEQVFRRFGNNVHDAKPATFFDRSMSHGDLVSINATWLRCQATGWRRLSASEAELAQAAPPLPFRAAVDMGTMAARERFGTESPPSDA